MSEQHAQGADAVVDLNNELKTRREKLANLREQGIAFPNDFRRDHTSDQLHAEFDGKENEELEALNIEVAVAGRMIFWIREIPFSTICHDTGSWKSFHWIREEFR